MSTDAFSPRHQIVSPLCSTTMMKFLRSLIHPWYNAAMTMVLLYLGSLVGAPAWAWGVTRAIGPSRTMTDCTAGDGACWNLVADKFSMILVGFYPAEEAWRVYLALAILLLLLIVTLSRLIGFRTAVICWAIALPGLILLLSGGFWGLRGVGVDQWGGLLLTITLTLGAGMIAFPFGVMLALARRSKRAVPRTLATAYIELMRSIPLITVLFVASLMVPLFLPEGMSIAKVWRAVGAIGLCAAAYVAEAVRGGLLAVTKGQMEAAASLGLRPAQTKLLVQLPQALEIAVQPLLITFLDFFKGTSLVAIIGLFDVLGTSKAILANPQLTPHFIEMYIMAGAFYFVICLSASSYARNLDYRVEKRRHG